LEIGFFLTDSRKDVNTFNNKHLLNTPTNLAAFYAEWYGASTEKSSKTPPFKQHTNTHFKPDITLFTQNLTCKATEKTFHNNTPKDKY